MYINDKYDYELYVLAEANYVKKHYNDKNIFPTDWYSTKDYKYKTEVIAEALRKNILIEEKELYQNRFDNKKFVK